MKNALMWDALTATGARPGPNAPTREKTRWGVEEGRAEEFKDPLEKEAERGESGASSSKGDGRAPSKNIFRNRGRMMEANAQRLASRVKINAPRLIGLMENGVDNPQWVRAVARAVAATGVGAGTRRAWRESLSALGIVMFPGVLDEVVAGLEYTLAGWAGYTDIRRRTDEPAGAKDGMPVEKPGLAIIGGKEEKARMAEEEDSMRAFACAVSALGGNTVLESCRVCIICAYHHLREKKPVHSFLGPRQPTETEHRDAARRYFCGVPGTEGVGWLKAAAALHNREMHALNGNIDRVTDPGKTREEDLLYLKGQFWDAPPITGHEMIRPENTRKDCEAHLKCTYYNDQPLGSNAYYINAGTQHQYLGTRDELARFLNGAVRQRVNGKITIPENAWADRARGEAVDVVDEGELLGTFDHVEERIRWVGLNTGGFEPAKGGASERIYNGSASVRLPSKNSCRPTH